MCARAKTSTTTPPPPPRRRTEESARTESTRTKEPLMTIPTYPAPSSRRPAVCSSSICMRFPSPSSASLTSPTAPYPPPPPPPWPRTIPRGRRRTHVAPTTPPAAVHARREFVSFVHASPYCRRRRSWRYETFSRGGRLPPGETDGRATACDAYVPGPLPVPIVLPSLVRATTSRAS